MVTRMTTRKTAILLAVMALAALAAVLLHRSLTEAQEDRIHTMPPMTLVYKTDGPGHQRRGTAPSTSKKPARLDYTSRTKYLDSVRCPLYLDHASLLLGTDRPSGQCYSISFHWIFRHSLTSGRSSGICFL